MSVQRRSTYVLIAISIYLTVLAQSATPPNALGDGVVDKELILTQQEKVAFEKFRKVVQPHLFRDELKNNIFLLRWLRAKNLNVDVAVKDMMGLKHFYRENKIDSISDEDWSDFEVDMPFHLDAYDKEGRPVGYLWLREGWDFRAANVQGKLARLQRYLIKCTFDLMIKVHETHITKNPNVTQFVVLMNLDGYNLVQHVCPACGQSLLSLLTVYEKFLPGFSKEIILVEATPAVKTVFGIARPFLSKHTRDVVKMFDTNKKQWMPYIHARVDKSQLPAYFGGTRKEESDSRR